MIHRISALLMASTLLLGGCSSLISATRDEPIKEDKTTRTLGTYVDDQLIETMTLVNFNKATEAVKNSNISVTSFNGIVLLVGEVPNEYAKKEAEQITAQLRKVRKVHNELQISGGASSLSQTSDIWLTLKSKTQLLVDENVVGGRIKVVTDKGTVYLMGLVTPQEADDAVGVVSNISGVERIVKIFEYI
ncbi:BON domain-containing protein [Marinobacterium jannaschii]|uniref:BON domain-containing protein n=1 Tax=Marinobacterium jannaschii TaxID=64970 RepID=UPI000568F8B9|nr:BON domain-containing protein [Marinobacterium jannaschii]